MNCVSNKKSGIDRGKKILIINVPLMLSFFSQLVCRILYASAYAIHYIIYYEKRKTYSRNSLKSISILYFCFLYFLLCCAAHANERVRREKTAHIMNILMQYECIREEEKWETVVQSM